jgi:GntR family transcriptional regulator
VHPSSDPVGDRYGIQVPADAFRAASLAVPVPVCNTDGVSLLDFKSQPGQSLFDQLIFAAEKSFLGGEFSPGQAFPSVRTLAAELKIHPNTAQKIIHHLVAERWLEVKPGIGTVVAERPVARAADRKRLLNEEVERLIVEAKKVGASLQDVIQVLSAGWSELDATAAERRK